MKRRADQSAFGFVSAGTVSVGATSSFFASLVESLKIISSLYLIDDCIVPLDFVESLLTVEAKFD